MENALQHTYQSQSKSSGHENEKSTLDSDGWSSSLVRGHQALLLDGDRLIQN